MVFLLRKVFRLTFPSFQREKWKDKIETANLPLAGFISDESSVSDKFPARDGFSVSDMNSAIVPVVISIASSPRVASHSCERDLERELLHLPHRMREILPSKFSVRTVQR